MSSRRRLTVLKTGTIPPVLIVAISLAPVLSSWRNEGTKTTEAQTAPAKQWVTPRTSWGDPDLQGIWTNISEVTVPLERPADLAGRTILTREEAEKRIERAIQALASGGGTGAQPPWWTERMRGNSTRTSLIVDPPDGRIPPMTPRARESATRGQVQSGPAAWAAGTADSWENLSTWDRCITRGLPGSILPVGYNANYLILQVPGSVAILYEMIHEVRIIPVDGRPPVGNAIRHWMGDSRGRWEGETLVVDVTHFRGSTVYRDANPLDIQRDATSDTLRLVERFTRVNANTVDYNVTIADPATWTRPWTIASVLTNNGAPDRVYEYACHEGNYAVLNILSGARAQEKAAGPAARTK